MAAQKAHVPVTIVDSSQASIDKALKFADKLLEKDISKKRISETEASAVRERLSTSTSMDSLAEADFVIEAVPVRSVYSSHAARQTY